MAKNLTDNFQNSKWVGPTVKLTPTDKAGTPESFEQLYERRAAKRPGVSPAAPKLKPIEHSNMSDLMERVGLDS
jgi:hypothetical protein